MFMPVYACDNLGRQLRFSVLITDCLAPFSWVGRTRPAKWWEKRLRSTRTICASAPVVLPLGLSWPQRQWPLPFQTCQSHTRDDVTLEHQEHEEQGEAGQTRSSHDLLPFRG